MPQTRIISTHPSTLHHHSTTQPTQRARFGSHARHALHLTTRGLLHASKAALPTTTPSTHASLSSHLVTALPCSGIVRRVVGRPARRERQKQGAKESQQGKKTEEGKGQTRKREEKGRETDIAKSALDTTNCLPRASQRERRTCLNVNNFSPHDACVLCILWLLVLMKRGK